MTREEMMIFIHITDDTPFNEIMEKLFCLSVIPEGTDVTERTLKRYNSYQELYWGRIKGVKP